MTSVTLWARPGSSHYHSARHCKMLADGDFERLSYAEVSLREISQRKLQPCGCAQFVALLVRKGRASTTAS